MATKPRVSLEEFLAMPETEPPSELIDGEVIQKVAPNWAHGSIVSYVVEKIGAYLRSTSEGKIVVEVRHLNRSQQRVFLPDVNVTLTAHLPQRRSEALYRPIETPPDFAIEVLSPGTSSGRTLERVDFYMRSGTQLLWLIDPESETVTVYRPGEAYIRHRAPETIDARPVLRSLQFDLGELFAELPEGEAE